jgi:hypothetical protein
VTGRLPSISPSTSGSPVVAASAQPRYRFEMIVNRKNE